MKKRIYTILEIMFIALFIISAYKLYTIYQNYSKGDEIYDESAKTYLDIEKPSDDTDDKDSAFSVDFDALKEENSETLGWILIEDTPVSYPLMQTDNNDYYLKHTYNRIYSDFGSIFIDYRCSSDLSDKNTIIYGHNTKNDSMFGSLKKYKDAAYLEQHPFIYLIYEDYVYKYAIFSMFTTTTSSNVYTLDFESAADYRQWIRDMHSHSVVDTGEYKPTGKEKIITLSTCTSRTETERFVILAIQVEAKENKMISEAEK